MITIISPVYNSSKYLVDTINSVIRQDFQDWKLVFIDDMSTDNSVDIIKRFCVADNRIELLSTHINSGPARARNIGIDYAISNNSSYISFIDSDDMYESTYLSRMYKEISESDADVVWCNSFVYAIGHEDKRQIIDHHFGNKLLDKKEAISSFFTMTDGIGCLWNKMYRCSFIEKYHLRLNDERVRAEDWEFNLMLFDSHPIIRTIDEPLYNYILQNKCSVMRSFREKDYELYKRSLMLTSKAARKWNLENLMYGQYNDFVYNSICYIVLAVQTKQRKEIIEKVVNDEILRDAITNRKICNLTLKHIFYLQFIKYRLSVPLSLVIHLFK